MIDLLESNLDADAITAILRRKPLRPLLPPMNAPEWQTAQRKPAVQEWMKGVREMAEKDAFEPMPELTDELYAIYAKTGDRLTFESRYFERRRRVARIAMTVLFGDAATREKYLPRLIQKIEETMAEDSWTFPAHSGQVSGKDPMMIDLFAAETANLMGELFSVFGAVLSADLVQRIRARLRVEYFENYLKNHATFRWTSMENNWNSVCHQGVIGAALALETDMGIIGRMLALTPKSLRIFLSGFGADGSTSEGPGYWSYGFGRFAELNKQLETATDGELSVFGTNEKIKRIAEFAPALCFSNGYLVNFSDGGRSGRLNAALLDYLGLRLEMPVLRQNAAAVYRNQAESGIRYGWQRCDFFFYVRNFLACPDDVSKATEPARADAYFADYGAVVVRGNDAQGNLWEFAAKGGHNEEMHNHNDCGSFLLNFNGQPALIEIGAPEYVRDFFKFETRYEFLAARSLGHSVPYVNGCEQPVGREFAATVVDCKLEPDRVTFSVDLTKCYPAKAKLRKLVRAFTLEKSTGRLTVADAYELDGSGTVESMLVCGDVPVKTDGSSANIAVAGGTLRVSAVKGTALTKVDVDQYNDHEGKPQKINRLCFAAAQPASGGVIQYEITAAR